MKKNQIIPALMLCGIGALLLPAFRRAQDPNVVLCAKYMRSDIITLNAYAQDWDETYPSWNNNYELDNKLRPYQSAFTYQFACPATLKHFQFNNGLQGLTLAAILDLSTFEILRDAAPHPDGLISIGYGTGHIYHGGVFVGDTTQLCVENAKTLTLGIVMYAQDYDEELPPMNSAAQAKSVLMPYVKDVSAFTCPVTGTAYQFNSALSYTTLASYTNPSAVWVMKDAIPHPADGISTIGYLNGHVYRPGWPQYPLDGDTTKLCIDKEWTGTRIILMYAQDWDQTLPDMTDAARTITLLSPYTRFDMDFICPQTGLQYLFNSSISGRSLSSFANLNNYWALTDAAPHPDGQKTTSYLSGAVLHPGYVNPIRTVQECIKSVKQDLLGTLMYAQDYDEVLPDMHSPAEYALALTPYLQSTIPLTCPVINLPYLPSSEFSGVSLASINSPHTTLILQDVHPHPDGRTTLGYLDYHVGKKYLPRSGGTGIRRNVGGGGSRNNSERPTRSD